MHSKQSIALFSGFVFLIGIILLCHSLGVAIGLGVAAMVYFHKSIE